MRKNICIGGIGGQGIITGATILCEAAVAEGMDVTMIPHHEPAVRGGRSLVYTVISDRPVDCPCFDEADIAVCLSQEALESMSDMIGSSTTLIFDESVDCGTRVSASRISLPLNRVAREASCMYTGLIAAACVAGYTSVVAQDILRDSAKIHLGKTTSDVLAWVDSGYYLASGRRNAS